MSKTVLLLSPLLLTVGAGLVQAQSPVTIGVNAISSFQGPPSQAIDPSICGFAGFPVHYGAWLSFTPPITGVYDLAWSEIVPMSGYYYYSMSESKMVVYDQSTVPGDPALAIACGGGYGAAHIGYLQLVRGNTYLINLGPDSGTHSPFLFPGELTIELEPDTYPEVCNGDGGNQSGCTSCPCSNEAPAGTIGGCLNSSGRGSRVAAGGLSSVSLPSFSAGDLFFVVTKTPPAALCILKSGAAIAPNNSVNPCFGQGSGIQSMSYDGLRCAVQSTRRHGVRVASSIGTAGPWGGSGAPVAGIAQAGAGFIVGQTRYFQVVNRDDALAGCMRGLNTSQAVEVTFTF